MNHISIITKVERTPVASLQGMTRIAADGVRLPAAVSWEPLTVSPHAQLTVSSKQENGNTLWTAKLVFRTCDAVSAHGRWAYRCRLLDGRWRLIGTDGRPYAVATIAESMPARVADSQLTEVSVTWETPLFVPYIII